FWELPGEVVHKAAETAALEGGGEVVNWEGHPCRSPAMRVPVWVPMFVTGRTLTGVDNSRNATLPIIPGLTHANEWTTLRRTRNRRAAWDAVGRTPRQSLPGRRAGSGPRWPDGWRPRGAGSASSPDGATGSLLWQMRSVPPAGRPRSRRPMWVIGVK